MTLSLPLVISGSYLLGAIPTGYWLGLLWKQIDIRRYGSGNLGATNVFRVLGPGPGITTLAIDILKGLLPVLACKAAFVTANDPFFSCERVNMLATPLNFFDPCANSATINPITLATITGISTIAGHAFSIFVGFKGGKGVATSAGVFLALLPLPSAAALAAFFVVFSATRYVSLSSLVGAFTLVGSSFALSAPRVLSWTAVAIAIFVTWTHRANIKRLIQGTENRITWSKKTS